MTQEEARKAISGLGLYKLFWTEEEGGGTSLAAVGQDTKGDLWFAPTNWVLVPCFDWTHVDAVRKINDR